MGYKVAVVGATGNVGREMLDILAERSFPADEVVAPEPHERQHTPARVLLAWVPRTRRMRAAPSSPTWQVPASSPMAVGNAGLNC